MPRKDGAGPDALKRLNALLDEMVALRIEYDVGSKHEDVLATLGRTRALEVCTVLDKAIVGLKNVISGHQGGPPIKDPDAPSV